MVRFLRKWLIPILALLMVLGIVLVFVPVTEREESRAKSELTSLLAKAFDTLDDGASYAAPVIAAEEENLLSKASAVVRFLAHDDTLLATDALAAFCEQLHVDCVDVADIDGRLIASSQASRIGLDLGAQSAFGWAMEAADDAQAALTQTDETDQSLLYACVGRTDIEGFVLLTRDDPFVDDALQRSSTETLLSELPYNKDLVFVAAQSGANGTFYDAGNYCVRETQNGVTLIAARPTADVFCGRNAALVAFGAAALCIVICGIAWYLLRLDPLVTEEETEAPAPEEPGDGIPEESTDFLEEREAQLEIESQHERAEERAPRQARKTGKRKPPRDQNTESGENPFDQIVD
ncbi:MAG: hypothetical protein VB034_09410 [Eubacteriales bacterium]|nr:hypothetical protein [Eubacteriales bacterium]